MKLLLLCPLLTEGKAGKWKEEGVFWSSGLSDVG